MSLQTLLEKDAHYSQKIRIPEDKPWIKRIAAFWAHSGDSWFWGVALVLLWFVGPRDWRPQIALIISGNLLHCCQCADPKIPYQTSPP